MIHLFHICHSVHSVPILNILVLVPYFLWTGECIAEETSFASLLDPQFSPSHCNLCSGEVQKVSSVKNTFLCNPHSRPLLQPLCSSCPTTCALSQMCHRQVPLINSNSCQIHLSSGSVVLAVERRLFHPTTNMSVFYR